MYRSRTPKDLRAPFFVAKDTAYGLFLRPKEGVEIWNRVKLISGIIIFAKCDSYIWGLRSGNAESPFAPISRHLPEYKEMTVKFTNLSRECGTRFVIIKR